MREEFKENEIIDGGISAPSTPSEVNGTSKVCAVAVLVLIAASIAAIVVGSLI